MMTLIDRMYTYVGKSTDILAKTTASHETWASLRSYPHSISNMDQHIVPTWHGNLRNDLYFWEVHTEINVETPIAQRVHCNVLK